MKCWMLKQYPQSVPTWHNHFPFDFILFPYDEQVDFMQSVCTDKYSMESIESHMENGTEFVTFQSL